MQECAQCGTAVSERYWRVFSIGGELHGCLHCESKTGQHRATRPDNNHATATG